MKYEKIAKTLFEAFKKSKEYERLFWDVYNHGKPVTPKELQEKYGHNKRVFQRLNYYVKNRIFIKKKIGKGVTYEINPILKTSTVDQYIFFERLKKRKNGIIIDSRIPHIKNFIFNTHSIYGFPNLDDLTVYQQEIFYSILARIDEAFEDLKLLKKIIENSKLSQKEVVSGKLCFKYLLFQFNDAITEIMNEDFANEKSFRFLIELFSETLKLIKKHRIGRKRRIYESPQHFFLGWLNSVLFMMYNLKDYEKIVPHYITMSHFIFVNEALEGKWFFQKNKNFICYEDKWMKFRKSEGELALLSTPCLEEMRSILNIRTCLEGRLNKKPFLTLVTPKSKRDIINNMINVYIAISPALTENGFKTLLDKKDFENSKILQQYFSKKEINFMVDFIEKYGNSFGTSGFFIATAILFEAYSPGGIWFKKEWERKIRREYGYFKDRTDFSYEEILSKIKETFEDGDTEDIEGIATYLFYTLKTEFEKKGMNDKIDIEKELLRIEREKDRNREK